MNPWAIVAVVASVGKAYATYQQGMATKAYYDAKADEALLKYKSKEIDPLFLLKFLLIGQ